MPLTQTFRFAPIDPLRIGFYPTPKLSRYAIQQLPFTPVVHNDTARDTPLGSAALTKMSAATDE